MQSLPWHEPQWCQLLEMERAARVPHALLLWASPGIGASRFASRWAARLLCEVTGPDAPCGACRGCRLARAGSHPDLLQLAPPAPGRAVGIDAVRDLIARMALTAQYGGWKVAVIDPAESMTLAAANTLLKTLEEPPGDAVLMLVTRHGHLIPATIRSRCQVVKFPLPRADTVVAWLRGQIAAPEEAERLVRLAQGAPLVALALGTGDGLEQRETVLEGLVALLTASSDPVSVAERWRGVGPARVAYWISTVACDVIRAKIAGDPGGVASDDLAPEVGSWNERVDAGRMFDLFDACIEVQRVSARQSSLNEQLLLEGIALACHRVGAT